MTASQRLALALSFERLAARIASKPVTLPHPVIRRQHRVTASRRGTHRREEKYIEE